MKLNDEQKRLVEENHNLIYWYANKNNVNLDEWYDLLAIELCLTIMKYDQSKGALSTYFKVRADGMMCKEYRKKQAKKRIPHEMELKENIYQMEHTIDMTEEFEVQEWLEKVDSDILKLRIQGYNQIEIADKLELSQSYVSKALKRLRRDWNENNG